jgi:hypothetical protein
MPGLQEGVYERKGQAQAKSVPRMGGMERKKQMSKRQIALMLFAANLTAALIAVVMSSNPALGCIGAIISLVAFTSCENQ